MSLNWGHDGPGSAAAREVLGGAFGSLPGNFRGSQLACARWPASPTKTSSWGQSQSPARTDHLVIVVPSINGLLSGYAYTPVTITRIDDWGRIRG